MTLRVKLEVVPFGDEDKTYEIGRLDIYNKGIVEFGHAEYGVLDLSKGQEGKYVDTIFHRRDLGAWRLVKRALDKLGIMGP